MRLFIISLLLILIVVTPAYGQDSLLFATSGAAGAEHTLSGSGGTSMHEIMREDMAIVTPDPVAAYSAETYLCHTNFNTMAGDKDCVGPYYQAVLAQAVDAVLIVKNIPTAVRTHHVFFSPKVTIGTAGATATLDPGDVGSYRPGGNFIRFISEGQIRNAFGLGPAAPALNVDAIARDASGNVLLSFENNVMLPGGVMLNDGAVVCIPGPAIAYDPNNMVLAVAPNSGFIVATEATVDAMVANSLVSDQVGAAAGPILDLDGLEIDPGAKDYMKYQTEQFGTIVIPGFMFCGRGLQGGAVLSTDLGGSIAALNGVPLAQQVPIPTTGTDVGLLPDGNVRGLNGLAIAHDIPPLRFILDTATPTVLPGGVMEIDLGGAIPGSPLAVLWTLGAGGPCGVDPSAWLFNPGFNFIFVLAPMGPPIFLPPAGASFVNNLLVAPHPGFPARIVFQAATLTGGGALTWSAPATVEFL